MGKTCFIFGFGYSAQHLSPLLQAKGWSVDGTSRQEEIRHAWSSPQLRLWDFEDPRLWEAFSKAKAVLVSTPLDPQGDDPVLKAFVSQWRRYGKALQWIGYLSSTGVYGDHHGRWVDETTPPVPQSITGRQRLRAEQQWMQLGQQMGVTTHIFRLAGIYGPKRNALERVLKNPRSCMYKPNHFFSRIHVEDLAHVIVKALEQPMGNDVFNVADDCPACGHDVTQWAAKRLNYPPLTLIPIEQAKGSERLMAFYQENKKVCNRKIKTQLHVQLKYPTYREGLEALWQSMSFPR